MSLTGISGNCVNEISPANSPETKVNPALGHLSHEPTPLPCRPSYLLSFPAELAGEVAVSTHTGRTAEDKEGPAYTGLSTENWSSFARFSALIALLNERYAGISFFRGYWFLLNGWLGDSLHKLIDNAINGKMKVHHSNMLWNRFLDQFLSLFWYFLIEKSSRKNIRKMIQNETWPGRLEIDFDRESYTFGKCLRNDAYSAGKIQWQMYRPQAIKINLPWVS